MSALSGSEVRASGTKRDFPLLCKYLATSQSHWSASNCSCCQESALWQDIDLVPWLAAAGTNEASLLLRGSSCQGICTLLIRKPGPKCLQKKKKCQARGLSQQICLSGSWRWCGVRHCLGPGSMHSLLLWRANPDDKLSGLSTYLIGLRKRETQSSPETFTLWNIPQIFRKLLEVFLLSIFFLYVLSSLWWHFHTYGFET